MVISGSDGVTFPDSTNQFSGGAFSFKNRILNGDMRIDQRNAGASVTANDEIFGVDRWKFRVSQSSKLTAQQNAGSVTSAVGFINYLGVTSSSAFSSAASDFFNLQQLIEGLNFSDLGWGSSDAKSITISFFVRSSLTGTFSLSVCNSAANRNYIATYTVSSADTWEQKTITIAGDTTGTWLTTNGIGAQLRFDLGSGSNFNGTAGSWGSSNLLRTSGSQSVVGTNGATFYITGVQLEVGSVATPFERRPYGMELMLCQRYFAKMQNDGSGANVSLGVGTQTTTTDAYINIKYPVTMRSEPTVAISNTEVTDFTNFSNAATLSSNLMGYDSGTITCSYTTGGTANRPIFLIIANNTTGFLSLSAEL
jgi:hypothetical protein